MKLPSNLSWLKQHYEKVALVVILLGLAASAAVLGRRLMAKASEMKTTDRPVVARPDQGFKDLDFSGYSNGLAQLVSPAQIGDVSNRAFVSEIRVFCIQCGKWIGLFATNCPFCGAQQPESIDPLKADSDHDGVSDMVEQQYGLDIYNPDDVKFDHDGDGFSTLEEIKAGTNPRDPTSTPSIFAKLRLRRMVTQPFKLRFVAVQKLSETERRYQVNARTLDRTYFLKTGDTVEGFVVESYDEAADTLVLKRGTTVRRLQRGKVINDDQKLLMFVFLLDGSQPQCKVGDTFKIRGQTARAVEVLPDGRTVRIVTEPGGQEYLVTTPTSDEEAAMQLRQSNPLGGATGEFAPPAVPAVPMAPGTAVPAVPTTDLGAGALR